MNRAANRLFLLILLLPLSKLIIDSSDHAVLRSLIQVLYAYDSFPVLAASVIVFDFFVILKIFVIRFRNYWDTEFLGFFVFAGIGSDVIVNKICCVLGYRACDFAAAGFYFVLQLVAVRIGFK